MPLQAAAGVDLEHRPGRVADRQFEGGSATLTLERVGEGAEPAQTQDAGDTITAQMD